MSLSHSSAMAETLVVESANGYPGYAVTYPAYYKRYTGALFLSDADLPLPSIGGAQSYARAIFHSAGGKHRFGTDRQRGAEWRRGQLLRVGSVAACSFAGAAAAGAAVPDCE
jgi:hypothetical protein